MERRNRRSVLASLGVLGTASVVGCTSFTGRSEEPPASPPTVEPTTTLRPPTTETAPTTATSTTTPGPTATMPRGVSKVLAEDDGRCYLFGSSVAASGETVLVQAPSVKTEDGAGQGAVYIFERKGKRWRRQAKIDSSVTSWELHGAYSRIALDGSTALVRSYHRESEKSRVLVFERTDSGWGLQTTFPLDSESSKFFGESLDLQGETALVSGQWEKQVDGSVSGGVYVFEQIDRKWQRKSMIAPEEMSIDDEVGETIALDNGTAFVSHFRADHTDSVDVFKREGATWSQSDMLTKSGTQGKDDTSAFGASIAAWGNTVLVGAPWDEGKGAVYAFECSEGKWGRKQRLTASDGDSEDIFGIETALNDDFAIIAASRDEDPNGDHAGSAYVFERRDGTWKERAKLVAPDGEPSDMFGWSVAMTDKIAVIGARRDDNVRGTNAGGVYLYDLSTELEG